MNLPKNANFIITLQPVLEFIEFATYVLGCFNCWFGYSVMTLDPVSLFDWVTGLQCGKVKEHKKESRERDGNVKVRRSLDKLKKEVNKLELQLVEFKTRNGLY